MMEKHIYCFILNEFQSLYSNVLFQRFINLKLDMITLLNKYWNVISFSSFTLYKFVWEFVKKTQHFV